MRANEWDRLSAEKEYFSDVISPFDDSIASRKIKAEIKKFSGSRKKAADLGCGLGKLLPFLSKNFKEVRAVDFSGEMLGFSMKKNRQKNIVFEKKDLRELGCRQKFDVAASINSVLPPSAKEADKILKNISGCLKKNGALVGVFPSMESVIYTAMLVNERLLKKNSEKIAMKKTREIIESREYDFLFALLTEKGSEQKHFYGFELEHRLKKAGFRKIRIEKIHYGWKILEDKRKYFPKEEKIWDWLVTALK